MLLLMCQFKFYYKKHKCNKNTFFLRESAVPRPRISISDRQVNQEGSRTNGKNNHEKLSHVSGRSKTTTNRVSCRSCSRPTWVCGQGDVQDCVREWRARRLSSKLRMLQPVSYKRYFRCNNCFLLLVYTFHLSLSTDLEDPPPMGTIYMKHPYVKSFMIS